MFISLYCLLLVGENVQLECIHARHRRVLEVGTQKVTLQWHPNMILFLQRLLLGNEVMKSKGYTEDGRSRHAVELSTNTRRIRTYMNELNITSSFSQSGIDLHFLKKRLPTDLASISTDICDVIRAAYRMIKILGCRVGLPPSEPDFLSLFSVQVAHSRSPIILIKSLFDTKPSSTSAKPWPTTMVALISKLIDWLDGFVRINITGSAVPKLSVSGAAPTPLQQHVLSVLGDVTASDTANMRSAAAPRLRRQNTKSREIFAVILGYYDAIKPRLVEHLQQLKLGIRTVQPKAVIDLYSESADDVKMIDLYLEPQAAGEAEFQADDDVTGMSDLSGNPVLAAPPAPAFKSAPQSTKRHRDDRDDGIILMGTFRHRTLSPAPKRLHVAASVDADKENRAPAHDVPVRRSRPNTRGTKKHVKFKLNTRATLTGQWRSANGYNGADSDVEDLT